MQRNPSRPLSPHLTIWRWGPHMAVSILHRITGVGLATVGAIAFVWWLSAAAVSPAYYDYFIGHATSWYGVVIGIGLSWAFLQHTLSGIRHFVLDIGAGYELSTNKFWSVMTLAGSAALTVLLWLFILGIG